MLVFSFCRCVITHRKYSFILPCFQMKNSIFSDNVFTNVNSTTFAYNL